MVVYDLYTDNNIYTLGHMGFIVLRKILYSFALVFLNHNTI